jgi:cyclase
MLLTQNIAPVVPFLLLACMFVLCAMNADGGQQSSPLFTLKQVGRNVWAAIEPQGQSNAGFVIGDGAVAVIDTFVSVDSSGNFGSQAAAKQMLDEIRKLTKDPIKFVINTHYHLDHVAGNGVFVESGAAVLAQRNVRDWIRTENLKLFGNDIKPEQKAFIEALDAPVVTYDEALDLYLGSRKIQVRSFPGHTGGDSVVLVPDAKTIFGGDLFWRNTLPNLMDSSTKSWIDTLDTLLRDLPGYTFVSGHGDVGDVQDVAAFRDYLGTLRRLVTDSQAQGRSGEMLVKAVVPNLAAKYGQWDFFNYLAERNVVDVEAELIGTKRIPQPKN